MKVLDRLSVKLTLAFVLAAVLGVVLVALLTYRSTSSEFGVYVGHMGGAGRMMGGERGAFSEAEKEFLDNLGQTLWIAGGSGVALAILLGGIFARNIIAPLDKVTSAAKRIAQGDLEQRVDIQGSGEVAELGESFNGMAETLSRDRDLRQNMIADIAHELRTPLSILQGNTEAMIDGVMKPDAENLGSIHQETLHLAQMVDDLRTLSLAEAGQLKYHLQNVNISEVVTTVMEGYKAQLAGSSIHAMIKTEEGLPTVWADPDRIAQVIRNLLGNAIKYSPEGSSITFRLTAGRDGVKVSVIDDGIGIPAEDLPHVFDRFYRVDRSRSRSTGGSGLGLAIVKQLVEAQDGHVWAESTSTKGSTFSFLLPYSTH